MNALRRIASGFGVLGFLLVLSATPADARPGGPIEFEPEYGVTVDFNGLVPSGWGW